MASIGQPAFLGLSLVSASARSPSRSGLCSLRAASRDRCAVCPRRRARSFWKHLTNAFISAQKPPPRASEGPLFVCGLLQGTSFLLLAARRRSTRSSPASAVVVTSTVIPAPRDLFFCGSTSHSPPFYTVSLHVCRNAISSHLLDLSLDKHSVPVSYLQTFPTSPTKYFTASSSYSSLVQLMFATRSSSNLLEYDCC
ncbi:hypothetical protein OH76DRAFT_653016 [Lentinus brumalis]|uniref:Uncharacterized protein n=1 Tax=Lentinus brumalis TaxID=2498619 RepID=A0A371D7D3_9APHY|nr:hypothetical protein OH76DRAFT_653016 [Polyporus brumalis]